MLKITMFLNFARACTLSSRSENALFPMSSLEQTVTTFLLVGQHDELKRIVIHVLTTNILDYVTKAAVGTVLL